MKQVAAQIIDRIQRRIAARVVMTLSEAERALTLAQTEHFAQRVILCRDKQLGARAADIDPLTLLEEGKQRLRDCIFSAYFSGIYPRLTAITSFSVRRIC